jgi:large subunit ribosomal protein L15
MLAGAGLVSNAYVGIKLLKRGDLTKKVTVKLPSASKTAVEALEAAGGSFEKTPRLGRPVTATKKTQKTAKAEKAAK